VILIKKNRKDMKWNKKIKSEFYGKIGENSYKLLDNKYASYLSNDYKYVYKPRIIIYENSFVIGAEKFYECELDRPPYNVGEFVYINELDVEYEIEKVTRTIEGVYRYTCDYFIRSEDNAEWKKYYERELEKELKSYDEFLKREEERDKNSIETKNPWWKIW